jgi:hypothetical protein
MARFYFDLSHDGDVYHDALGKDLKGLKEAKETAFEIVRRLSAGTSTHDVICTLRDINGVQLLQISVISGVPTGRQGISN